MKFYRGCQLEGLAEFSTAVSEAPFASELLTQMERSGNYENVDDLVIDLMEGFENRGFNVDQESVIGLLTGEVLPTRETLEALQDLYDGEDEEEVADYTRLVEAAKSSYDQVEDYSDEDEYDEDEDEDLYDIDSEQDEYYEDEDEDEDPLEEYYSRVREMEEKQAVSDALGELIQYGSSLVEDGYLPPAAFHAMFGEGSQPKYAEFSSVSAERGLDNVDHLEAIRYALDVFASCGQAVQFSQVVMPDYEEIAEERGIEAEALAAFKAYRQDVPYQD